jgi:hypothetical protein
MVVCFSGKFLEVNMVFEGFLVNLKTLFMVVRFVKYRVSAKALNNGRTFEKSFTGTRFLPVCKQVI